MPTSDVSRLYATESILIGRSVKGAKLETVDLPFYLETVRENEEIKRYCNP